MIQRILKNIPEGTIFRFRKTGALWVKNDNFAVNNEFIFCRSLEKFKAVHNTLRYHIRTVDLEHLVWIE